MQLSLVPATRFKIDEATKIKARRMASCMTPRSGEPEWGM
jgi:hypothetical protein